MRKCGIREFPEGRDWTGLDWDVSASGGMGGLLVLYLDWVCGRVRTARTKVWVWLLCFALVCFASNG